MSGEKKVTRKGLLRQRACRLRDNSLTDTKTKAGNEEIIFFMIIEFLRIWGLQLNPAKSKVLCTKDGFKYFGFSVKTSKSKGSGCRVFLKIKPSKQDVKAFKVKIKAIVKKYTKEIKLIQELNPVLKK